MFKFYRILLAWNFVESFNKTFIENLISYVVIYNIMTCSLNILVQYKSRQIGHLQVIAENFNEKKKLALDISKIS